MLINKDRSRYQAYLLRLWQMNNDDQPVWRISLESTGSGETQHFKSVAAFYAFVEALVDQPDADGDSGN